MATPPHSRSLPVLAGWPPQPGEVVQSEPMLRYACNQQGCCCRGWQIRFSIDDFIRLHDHLPEPDRSDLARGLKLLLDDERDEPGRQAVLHSLRLGTVGEDERCRFLEGEGGCRVHAAQGLVALPDICVDFPAAGFRTPDQAAVELWWDPICPEVLRQLDESDAPLGLHRAPPPPVPDLSQPVRSPADGFAFRVRNAREAPQPRIGDTPVTRAELEHVRETCLKALHHPSRAAWRSLHAVAAGFRALRAGRALDFQCAEPEDAGPFLRHFWSCIGAHGARILASTLLRYRRFALAADVTAALADLPRMVAVLEAWPKAFERRLAAQEDALRPLQLRYLAHRFSMPYVNQDGELRTSADTIVFTFATALRLAAALGELLGRDVDRPLFQVALGASEHFWRSVEVPAELLPWYCAAAV